MRDERRRLFRKMSEVGRTLNQRPRPGRWGDVHHDGSRVFRYPAVGCRRGCEGRADERLTEKFPSTSDLPFSQTHLMGSSAKNTITRPFDDVDVLAVFSNAKGAWSTYQWDSKSFIYRIRSAHSGVSIQQVGTRGQAVRVFCNSGGHVDVAPVFDAGNGVYKPSAGDGTWINTAPLVGTSWYAERNRGLSYHLSPVVRLLKAWNRAHSMRFRSFHLETLAASGVHQRGRQLPGRSQSLLRMGAFTAVSAGPWRPRR